MNRSARFQTGLFPTFFAILLSANALAADGEFHLGLPPGHAIVKDGSPPGDTVGYVNTTVVVGWNLLQNPLTDLVGNRVADVMQPGKTPQTPDGTVILKPTAQGWVANNYLHGWSNPGLPLAPGEGFFMLCPSNTTLTFVGHIPEGIFRSHLPAGDSLAGSMLPIGQSPLTGSRVNFPAKAGDRVYRLHPGTAVFDSFSFDGAWHPEEPKPMVAEAFWLHQEQAVDWNQTFSRTDTPLPPDAPIVEEVFPPTITGTGGLVDFFTCGPGSRIYASDGVTPLDSHYVGQLWAIVDGLSLPITAPIPFGNGAAAGWLDGGLVTLPETVAGKVITMWVQCWSTAGGPSYNDAYIGRAEMGSSAGFTCQVGVSDAPGILPGITSGLASFRLARPKIPGLYCVRSGDKLELRWPSAWFERTVESASSTESFWSPVAVTVVVEDDEAVAVVPLGTTNQFFRLGPLPY